MWQICGHVPQSLLVLNDITFRAAQLSVSFFIETFIHAKEKVTLVIVLFEICSNFFKLIAYDGIMGGVVDKAVQCESGSV